MLDSNKKDILKELLNVSIGRAAGALARIVNKKILLNIPDVVLYDSRQEFFSLLRDITVFNSESVVSSTIYFGDEIRGKAQLCYASDKLKRLISFCMGEEDSADVNIENVTFMDDDFDVILEIGNIALNSILGGLGNSLAIKFNYSTPVVEFTERGKMTSNLNTGEESCFMLIYVSFIINGTNVDGAIVVMLSLNALPILMEKLERLQVNLNE